MAERSNCSLLVSFWVLLAVFSLFPVYGASGDKALYEEIKSSEARNDIASLRKNGALFVKKYSGSKYAPSVMLLMAENSADVEDSVKKLSEIVEKYRNFTDRDYCQYKICQIYYLSSRWRDLSTEAEKGLRLFGEKNRYSDDFKFFSAKSCFYMQNYTESVSTTNDLIQNSRKYYYYPEASLFSSYVRQNTKGNSKNFLVDMKEIYFSYEGAGVDVSALYMFGRQCEYMKDYNRSYSAYSDLVKKFPKSPEAKMARIRLEDLGRWSPKYISNYFPDSKRSKDSLPDLSPETEVRDESGSAGTYYAIEIGPIYNLAKAKIIKKEIFKEFKNSFVVKKNKQFSIYVGRCSTTEEALSVRIRLAEEYGLNGNILYVRNEKGLDYIYDE